MLHMSEIPFNEYFRGKKATNELQMKLSLICFAVRNEWKSVFAQIIILFRVISGICT